MLLFASVFGLRKPRRKQIVNEAVFLGLFGAGENVTSGAIAV